MTMIGKSLLGALAAAAITAFAGSANAQATRTWVSGVGDDANPCSRTAPCKTFAGAISKTAAGGEIDCLDPGGFGGVTITKAITIDCAGVTGGVLVAGGGVNGVIINVATANAHVNLRNLTLIGVGTAANAVRILSCRFVTLDNVVINGFTGNGVDLAPAAGAVGLVIDDTHITNTGVGVKVSGAGSSSVSINNLTTANGGRGIELATGSAIISVDSSAFQNHFIAAVATTAGTGTINVAGSLVANNVLAFGAGVSGSTIRISDNDILNNVTGFTIAAGATIASGQNNTSQGNGGATVPNATFNEI
jgi:hypothetical protein